MIRLHVPFPTSGRNRAKISFTLGLFLTRWAWLLTELLGSDSELPTLSLLLFSDPAPLRPGSIRIDGWYSPRDKAALWP